MMMRIVRGVVGLRDSRWMMSLICNHLLAIRERKILRADVRMQEESCCRCVTMLLFLDVQKYHACNTYVRFRFFFLWQTVQLQFRESRWTVTRSDGVDLWHR